MRSRSEVPRLGRLKPSPEPSVSGIGHLPPGRHPERKRLHGDL
ncbi:hypothetical protein HMPREF0185_03327 [Brevundimonas diminuta 470-4]|nr:hypothetical protein HMPREF0185_03327 [Brevundimonas diminuta 470-4]